MNPSLYRTPYFFHVQTDFVTFWSARYQKSRKVLFIFGLGFDPRCVPAFRLASQTFADTEMFRSICLRFRNPSDENLDENTRGTRDSLREIDSITADLSGPSFRHDHLEVNLFDSKGNYEGHKKLVSQFHEEFGSELSIYTDIIVDISAFPRSLIYALLTAIQDRIRPNQNLYSVLSEVAIPVELTEDGYSPPHYILEPSEHHGGDRSIDPQIWIPVLGGSTERLELIYKYLSPREVFPIVPFPTRDPRSGDLIVLRARKLFDEWHVPFNNIMYACGDVPFDIYRKIHDVVNGYKTFTSTDRIVVSALSGRSLSLGVLLAAWEHDLPVCQIQPKTYRLLSPSREDLQIAAQSAKVTLYWLRGEIYQ